MKRKRRDELLRASRPKAGSAASGVPIDPTAEPEGHSADAREGRPKRVVAPAPGVPMSAREYERLKDEAARGRAPEDAPACEDRPRHRDARRTGKPSGKS